MCENISDAGGSCRCVAPLTVLKYQLLSGSAAPANTSGHTVPRCIPPALLVAVHTPPSRGCCSLLQQGCPTNPAFPPSRNLVLGREALSGEVSSLFAFWKHPSLSGRDKNKRDLCLRQTAFFLSIRKLLFYNRNRQITSMQIRKPGNK